MLADMIRPIMVVMLDIEFLMACPFLAHVGCRVGEHLVSVGEQVLGAVELMMLGWQGQRGKSRPDSVRKSG